MSPPTSKMRPLPLGSQPKLRANPGVADEADVPSSLPSSSATSLDRSDCSNPYALPTSVGSPLLDGLTVRAVAGKPDVRASALLQRMVAVEARCARAIQPFSLDHREWNGVDRVRRSHHGLNEGAWFFSSLDTSTLVVKEAEDRASQYVAGEFLRFMGFRPPEMVLVSTESDEGKIIADIAAQKADPGDRMLGFTRPAYYIVMNFVEGIALEDIRPDTLAYQDALAGEEKLRELGRLVAFDLLMGNGDRFNLSNYNANYGNLMVEKRNQELRPIDQVFVDLGKSDQLGFARLVVKRISQGSMVYADKIAHLLQEKLGKTYPSEPIQQGLISAIASWATDEFVSEVEAFKTRMQAALGDGAVPDITALCHLARQCMHTPRNVDS